MELRFKPQFKRDYLKIKSHKVKVLLAAHLRQIMQAETVSQTGQLSKLEKYESRYKIRITVDEKDDYRAGFEIKKNIIWAERILRRPSFYEHYRR
ncbi:MAG: hypothetical protein HY841_14760 [Bacteroidetes bacterium]|nr:hypothetical protein [Bacteroidota bacterium]